MRRKKKGSHYLMLTPPFTYHYTRTMNIKRTKTQRKADFKVIAVCKKVPCYEYTDEHRVLTLKSKVLSTATTLLQQNLGQQKKSLG